MFEIVQAPSTTADAACDVGSCCDIVRVGDRHGRCQELPFDSNRFIVGFVMLAAGW